jgi:aryl-alcohol dehydrogenase-like predicted oxidoreductase
MLLSFVSQLKSRRKKNCRQNSNPKKSQICGGLVQKTVLWFHQIAEEPEMNDKITTLSGSEINPFCFGTMQWGGKADPAALERLYHQCRDAGINHFDTAFSYCEGASETLLGVFCKAERDALLIATKVGHVGGGGKTNLLSQFDQCQKRLKMDMVDVLYLHRFDPDTPIAETLETLAELKQSGKIRYIGVSNFSAWQGVDALHHAKALGLKIDFFQPMYNLVKRQAEVEILPMCAAKGITVAAYSPLGGGLLTGKYLRGEQGRLIESEMYAARYEPAFMREAAKRLCDLADELGVNPATLAVAWVHAHPTKPMPIISASGADQLAPSIKAMSFPLSEDLYNQISALSPTPPPATDRIEEA